MSVTSSQVPELMKLGEIPTNLAQDVTTDILDPVVFSQTFCRFTLERKGFLHSFSRLTLELDKLTNASNQNATYPANIGIHSLIERATLKVGAQTICEIEDFNKYMAYKSMFIQNDINAERESVLTGRIMNHGFTYTDNNDVLTNNFNATGYHLDNGTNRLGDQADDITPAGAEWLPTATTSASFEASGIQVNDNLLLHNEPVLQIALSDLFPFLRFNQLPLYMMDEQVSIELVFANKTSNDRFTFGTGADSTENASITQGAVQMVADYIFYDGETMRQYSEANSNMTWNYIDYRLTKRSYSPGISASQTQQILNVGGAGRIVNKLIVGMFDDSASDVSVLGPFGSYSASLMTNNVGQITTNVRYNDHYLYPIDRTLSAIQFHDVVQTENNIAYVSRDEYNQEGGGDGGGISATNFNGLAIDNDTIGLRGKFNWQAHRLNRNERISSRGIELETLYSGLLTPIADSYTQRVWIEIVRSATLVNGMVNCYYA